MSFRKLLFVATRMLAAAVLVSSAVSGCAPSAKMAGGSSLLADPAATPETRALFLNLQRLAPDHVLLGHHDDTSYGVGWHDEAGRSDVKESSGSYPALYGWDVMALYNHGQYDPARAQRLRERMLQAYERGGVNALAWHMDNPVSGGNAWDTTRAVAAVLPGGSAHALYVAKLDSVAAFMKSLRASDGTLAPVIFRPFHEHTGSWFWWGRRHSSIDEFKRLWQFTVTYLRDQKHVHNLLYSYSSDVFATKEAYLERYPGDAFIDVLGLDDYQSIKTVETGDVFVGRLRMLVEMAESRGKLAAVTETGVEGVPDANWWTGVLLPALQADPVATRISFLMLWRNAFDIPGHHYAPYAGHPSAPDFVRFRDSNLMLFEDELPPLYKLP